ncbi:MAG: hypothetical protein AAB903_03155 [Patescibacteria group bacterium]
MHDPKAASIMRKLQFTVDAETVENLEFVQRCHRDSSLAQSFRRSVAITHFFDKMFADGFEFILRKDGDTYKVLVP